MGICKKIYHVLEKNISSQRGFTLVELIVVIAIISVLLVGLIFTFNPLAQFDKAKDSQREHDLGQIQRALDSYFNDMKCYPQSLIFGTQWSVNNQVYMEKIPQDPNCSIDANRCYVYETDGSTCPQWNVLYASLRGPTALTNACPLVTRNVSTPCLPGGFTSNKYNYCAVSGNINCAVISTFTIGGIGTGGGGGGGGPTPTPTPPLSCPNDVYYGCTGDNRCNSISPKTQCTQFGGTVVCRCDLHCNQTCAFN